MVSFPTPPCFFLFFYFFFNLALFKLDEWSMTVINFQRSSKIASRSHAETWLNVP